MAHRRGEELLAWPVLGALILTAVNDHLGKLFFPGPITWKISDFSGLFFFPFFLTTLSGSIRHLSWAAVWTGIVFAILKLTGASMGPFHIARDPSDLMALICPALAVWYGKQKWPEWA